MSRSTRRKIKTTQVSTNEIREVFNSDSSSRPISQRIRKASDFFVDGNITNSIYNNFIDEEFCPVVGAGTKKDNLTAQPYSWGHWRNYGGVESEGDLPEIYWANVKTKNDVEHVPQTDELLLEFKNNKLIPRITITTPVQNAFGYIDETITKNLGLPTVNASYLHREGDNDITQAKLSTKVGIDYINNAYINVPEFDVKITPRLSFTSIGYSKYEEDYTVFDTLTGIVGPDILTITTLESFSKYVLENYNSWWKETQAWIASQGITDAKDIEAWNDLFGHSLTIAEEVSTQDMSQTISQLDGFSTFLLALNISNMIWNVTHPPARVSYITYQFQQLLEGVYTYIDIKDSTYKIEAGNEAVFNSATNYNISEIGTTHSYTLNSPNFGQQLSPSNLITRFPNKHPNRDKFLNFWFNTKAYQYDFCTPPPVVEYLVELIPTGFCKLSETKVTAWVLRVLPDKYNYPLFDLESEVYEAGNGLFAPRPVLYNNTSLLFKNAKFADLVLLNAKERSASISIPGFGDYFGRFLNGAVNSCYNNRFSGAYYGQNIGKDVFVDFKALPQPYFYGKSFVGTTGEYKTSFNRETQGNQILNPYFRIEKDDDFALEMAQFWNHSSGVKIVKGGAIKESASATIQYIEQNLPNVIRGSSSWPSFYLLDIEFTSSQGVLAVDTNNSSFYGKIYDKHNPVINPLGSGLYREEVIPDAQWGTPATAEVKVTLEDYGVSLGGGLIMFQNSGKQSVLLLAEPDNTNKKIRISMSPDFIGIVKTCTLTRLPNGQADTRSSSLQSYLPEFMYRDENLTSRTFFMFYRGACSVTIIVAEDNVVEVRAYQDDKFQIGSTLVLPTGTHTIQIPAFQFKVHEEYKVINVKSSPAWDYDYPCKIPTITCNSLGLAGFYDPQGVLQDSTVDFSNSGIQEQFFYDIPYTKSYNITLVNYLEANPILLTDLSAFNSFKNAQRYFSNRKANTLKNLPITINSLNVSGSNLINNINSLRGVIQEYVNLSNTVLEGNFIELLYIPEVIVVNTKISVLGSGVPAYAAGTEPKVTWKNSDINIIDLNRLLYLLDETQTLNGYLDIGGDNPPILDFTALDAITSLVGKGWNVIYNTIEYVVDDNGDYLIDSDGNYVGGGGIEEVNET